VNREQDLRDAAMLIARLAHCVVPSAVDLQSKALDWLRRRSLAPNFLRGGYDMHPAIEHVLKFFTFAHLPEKLQAVSKPFADLANQVAERAPDSQETMVALRKLLEAKDAAVRAVL
jgi:hypothetical protein